MELHKMTTSKVAVDHSNRTNEELMEALEVLRQKMIQDYGKMGSGLEFDIAFDFQGANAKYIRVVHVKGAGHCDSCNGFIVKDRNHKIFPFGTLLMSAGWKAPAMNKSRGNVFELEGKRVAWTGIQ